MESSPQETATSRRLVTSGHISFPHCSKSCVLMRLIDEWPALCMSFKFPWLVFIKYGHYYLVPRGEIPSQPLCLGVHRDRKMRVLTPALHPLG